MLQSLDIQHGLGFGGDVEAFGLIAGTAELHSLVAHVFQLGAAGRRLSSWLARAASIFSISSWHWPAKEAVERARQTTAAKHHGLHSEQVPELMWRFWQ